MKRILIVILISMVLTATITFIATSSCIIEVFGQSYEYK